MRLLAMGFCLISIEKAWAGIWFYQGQAAFKKGDFHEALRLFERSEKWDSRNPRLIYLLGQSCWHLGVEKKDRISLESAERHLGKLVHELPHYGRGWLYLALVRITIQEQSAHGLTKVEWQQKIRPVFEEAYRKEPTSSWMNYMTGSQALSRMKLLSDEEIKTALNRIKKSVAAHYPDQPSFYLRPALSLLWRTFSNFELLKDVTPVDAASYDLLVQFVDEHGLWVHRDEVYPSFVILNNGAYEKQCIRAEKFLIRGRFRRAFIEFQKAFWINQISVLAKAGMLITQVKMNQAPARLESTLKEILEADEDNIGGLLVALHQAVEKYGTPYLKGIYAFRNSDFTAARNWLDKTPAEETDRFRRRFLAASYWQLGEREKAFETLKPTLGEKDVDLRELYLLKQWESPYRQQAAQKIESVATVIRTAEEWWGWGKDVKGLRYRLDRRARMGVMVNLRPGHVRLGLTLRSLPDGNGRYGYLLVRLWDKERERRIGTAYVNFQDWHRVKFEVETLGGDRWLEVELLNGKETAQGKAGPVVEFGPLLVEYP